MKMIKLDIKGYGSMLIELDPVAAPKTVANFEALVEKGFFDGLTYAFSRFGGMLIPFFKGGKEHLTYYDYKMKMKDKRAHGYSFMFFVGIVFVAIAVVFIALFYSI